MFCPEAAFLCFPGPVTLALGLAGCRPPAPDTTPTGRDLVNQARA